MDIFLKITEGSTPLAQAPYDGESVDAQHVKWINVLDFSISASTEVTIGIVNTTVGAPNHSDLTVTCEYEKTTPVLFLDLCKGTRLDSAKLACRTLAGPTAVDFVVYDFTELFVTSISTSGSSGESRPNVALSFAYTTVKQSYRRILGNGTISPLSALVTAGWNRALNTPL